MGIGNFITKPGKGGRSARYSKINNVTNKSDIDFNKLGEMLEANADILTQVNPNKIPDNFLGMPKLMNVKQGETIPSTRLLIQDKQTGVPISPNFLKTTTGTGATSNQKLAHSALGGENNKEILYKPTAADIKKYNIKQIQSTKPARSDVGRVIEAKTGIEQKTINSRILELQRESGIKISAEELQHIYNNQKGSLIYNQLFGPVKEEISELTLGILKTRGLLKKTLTGRMYDNGVSSEQLNKMIRGVDKNSATMGDDLEFLFRPVDDTKNNSTFVKHFKDNYPGNEGDRVAFNVKGKLAKLNLGVDDFMKFDEEAKAAFSFDRRSLRGSIEGTGYSANVLRQIEQAVIDKEARDLARKALLQGNTRRGKR